MPKGAGSITEVRDGVYKLTVTSGAHADGCQRRVARTVEGTKPQAAKLLASFVNEVGDSERTPLPDLKDLTVNDLIVQYLAGCTNESAENPKALAHSTLVRYEDLRKNWIRPSLGLIRVRALTETDIDRLFAVMRNTGKSHSHMNQCEALLNGALRWARRRRIIARNPMSDFELPRSKHVKREVIPPEVHDLIALLNGANEFDTELAPVLALAATTGLRRGELSGLRRDRVDFEAHRLRVDTAVNDAGGTVVIKTTKTHQARWLSIDPATTTMLARHLVAMDDRARNAQRRSGRRRIRVLARARLFSADATRVHDPAHAPTPDQARAHERELRGIDPRASEVHDDRADGRRVQPVGRERTAGHTVQVMLSHYSKRRASADIAAAEHLGRVAFGGAESG